MTVDERRKTARAMIEDLDEIGLAWALGTLAHLQPDAVLEAIDGVPDYHRRRRYEPGGMLTDADLDPEPPF